MLDLDDRLDELAELGLHQRMRMVSGPQGPRVVLDGRPVLLLCSGNALGLADHPRVRQAAADAAMRWGVGAGAARVASGTMTLHRRLEERLAAFLSQRAALLFGSGALANLGTIPALARRGEIVLFDELSHPSIQDGCRLSGAEAVPYRHTDADHLAWALRQADGRAALIATDGMFGLDGDVAPLAEIVALAREGFEVAGAYAHVVPLVVGDAEVAAAMADHALEQGVFTEAVRPPAVPQGTARVRLAAMASHTRAELRDAARVLGRAALWAGFRPGAGVPVAAVQDLPRAA